MSEFLSNTKLLLPVSLVLGGFIVGIIFEKVILARLKKMAAKTKWEGDEIIVGALRRMTTLWFVIAGIYAAIHTIQVSPTLLNVLKKVLISGVILSVTIVASKIAVGFVNLYSKKTEGILPSTSIFTNLTKLLVLLIGVLIILQTLGISTTPILTALGVGGLAVALALQDTLSNLFAGIHILLSRKIKPGDYVKLESGEEGYVTDITLRNTTIRALPNNMIILPNSKLASAIVTNFYQPEREMAVLVQMGVAYPSDLKKVEEVTIQVGREVMQQVQGGVPGFEPFIRYHTFGDSSINFTVILRAQEYTDQYLIKHEFVKRLHQRYQKEGIEIPFPIRTIYMKGEDGT
ncbi:MAG: mechanosensitive ion channel family protein [Candidatus Zixiibacteriota bacterium]